MQESFGFAVGEAPGQVVFRFSDSDGIDRWVYDLGRMKFWHDWWFVGLRSASEYALRRDPDAGWQIRLERWQEFTKEPASDLSFNGSGAWYAATMLPKEPEQRAVHDSLCTWHAVREGHRAELEKVHAGAGRKTAG